MKTGSITDPQGIPLTTVRMAVSKRQNKSWCGRGGRRALNTADGSANWYSHMEEGVQVPQPSDRLTT